MKSLLVHLAGSFSAEIGSELYLKIKEESSSPCLFALDATELTEVTEIGAEYLRKISTRCKESGSRIAVYGLQSQIGSSLQGLIPEFPTKEDCLLFLESFVTNGAPANVLLPNQTETSSQRTVVCPECGSLLRWKRAGDHLCPNCQSKFFVNQKGWVSTYERLL
ncbi:hypothetical protein P3G55_08155 [Leptospira sp. 96542]|nr:hypothetical protein [Leptospira sp. 96542]